MHSERFENVVALLNLHHQIRYTESQCVFAVDLKCSLSSFSFLLKWKPSNQTMFTAGLKAKSAILQVGYNTVLYFGSIQNIRLKR